MTQPYSFTHTADTKHAKASAATRLRSSPVLGSLKSDCLLTRFSILPIGVICCVSFREGLRYLIPREERLPQGKMRFDSLPDLVKGEPKFPPGA